MSNTNTGGPAFPCLGNENAKRQCEAAGVPYQSPTGMTLRDYFAAKAMQGDFNAGVSDNEFNAVAKRAYEMANAMLKARDA